MKEGNDWKTKREISRNKKERKGKVKIADSEDGKQQEGRKGMKIEGKVIERERNRKISPGKEWKQPERQIGM